MWRYLRYVLAAAHKRSFRRAAAELGVREWTIRCSIRDLEDEVGVPSLYGTPGGVDARQRRQKIPKIMLTRRWVASNTP
ncbi:LysR family transcriptional regulator [Bradyrhizobium sp. Rc2d]|uniref:LysR family transcriptional regulator n=1 Tax=Bradyrhizobium sp. Rc2d TaxID=1855321 RepID=UPI001FCD9BB7|nr:LysR family transcriptional regulator [Bradyrhizobium sp. Rc2d]